MDTLEMLRRSYMENNILDIKLATQALLNSNQIQMTDRNGWSALMYASRYGDADLIRTLLALEIDVDFKDGEGRTSLHIATIAGHLDVVKLLINSKAQVTSVDSQGHDPLMYACMHGHTDIAKSFVNLGCNPIIHNEMGILPLQRALANHHYGLIRELLKETFDIHVKYREGKNILMLLCISPYAYEIIPHIVNAGVDINARDHKGRTALMYTSINGLYQNVKTLLNLGADATIICGAMDAVTYAKEYNHHGVAKLLKECIDRE